MLARIYSHGVVRIFVLLAAVLLLGCHRETPTPAGPLTQRGYLWQRDWNPAVSAAVGEAANQMDGLVVLAAEIHVKGKKPSVIIPEISWTTLKNARKPCSLALRLEATKLRFSQNPEVKTCVKQTALALLKSASDQGVALAELQLDYDCASSKLDDYRVFVEELKIAIRPTPLVITSLPAWLNEPAFPALIRSVNAYVLQVHSVPTQPESGRESLCDPVLARKWVGKASKLGIPFSVALPTYHAIGGYDPSGKLLGVVMDSIHQSWPPGTRILDFAANPDQIADLIAQWTAERPPGMKEVLWYRVPVPTDQENWRWPTLNAVMNGRKPKRQLEATISGTSPIDLHLINLGEAEEALLCTVTATWQNGNLVASDALSMWTVEIEKGRAVFKTEPGVRLRISPGDQIDIGWLRFDQAPNIRLQLQNP